MKKKIVYGILTIVSLMIVLTCIRNNIEKNNIRTQERQNAREERLDTYSATLRIQGDFVVDGDKVTVNNKMCDEKELIKWVSLHNAFYKDSTIAIEELMKEYDIFCDGMEESELIETYRDRMHTIGIRAEDVEIFVNGYDYDRVIIEYLKENYDTRLSRATVEEMKVACPYAAEEIYKEVLRLEEQE